MARIRSLRPEWLTRPALVFAPPHARLIALFLLQIADDEGRLEGDPQILRSRLYLHDPPRRAAFNRALKYLEERGEIVRYLSATGAPLISLPGYRDPTHWQYQRIDRPQASRL